jgi:TPR repeat protein
MAIAWVLGAFSISPRKEEARAPVVAPAEPKVTRESAPDRTDRGPVEAAAAPGVDRVLERPVPPVVAAAPPSPAPAPAPPAPPTEQAGTTDKAGATIAVRPGAPTNSRETAPGESATAKAPKEKAGPSQRGGAAPTPPRSTSDEPARTATPALRDRAPANAVPDAATRNAAVDSARTADIAPVPKDLSDEARRLYASAQGGNAASQNALATMYFNGRGAPQSDAEAARWYAKAAEQGHANAQNALGFLYFSGRGVAKDQPEGARWWLKAAAQGHATAQNNIGGAYRYGYGVEKNEAEAVKWYRRSAEQGHAGSQKALGDMYFYGLGVPQQDAEAIAWYRKAAENGNQKAADELKAIEQLRAK